MNFHNTTSTNLSLAVFKALIQQETDEIPPVAMCVYGPGKRLKTTCFWPNCLFLNTFQVAFCPLIAHRI